MDLLRDEGEKNEGKVKLLRNGLDGKITRVLEELGTTEVNKDIVLMHLRQKIRTIQNEHIASYMRIYKMKDKVKRLDSGRKSEFEKEIADIHEMLLPLKSLYRQEYHFAQKSKEEIIKSFEEMTYEFENRIRPKIFSIELFWREIYSAYRFDKTLKIGEKNIFDVLTDLKAKEIMSNQPFEIIDGDALELPKDVMKQVFKPITDRCLVLTILGPQSSGKSTLLNFLFGCDFATSEGRCTRGVYGTFFRFNDQRISNFDGVFVIDTEGLFSITNKKDAKKEDREDFDSKLVLFCLAVSDFVIINVRGNLDHNTEKILRICYDKLEELRLPEDERPEFVIVLNQNNTSKTDESEN